MVFAEDVPGELVIITSAKVGTAVLITKTLGFVESLLRRSRGFVGSRVQGPPVPMAQPRLRGRDAS